MLREIASHLPVKELKATARAAARPALALAALQGALLLSTPEPVSAIQAIIDASTPLYRTFPQCGGTVGLEPYMPNHTFMIKETVNTDGSSFELMEDLGILDGQCGNPKL